VRRLIPVVALLPLLLGAAGCNTSKPGGSITTPIPSKPVIGTLPKAQTATVPAQFKNGDPTAGETIFKTGPCAGCHTLAKAGTHGTVGPNLDQAKPPLSRVVDRVLHGKGNMPPFRSQFSDKQIADVAAFVVQATGGNPNG
jgi:mono/diheme cytochrome c family protein